MNKIEHFSLFSSQSRINVLKLKEAEYCIETCCIVRSHRLIGHRIHFAHPFFPEISSSFKLAALLQRAFLKAMRVPSEAPPSSQHLAHTSESVDNTLGVLRWPWKKPYFPHTDPGTQSVAKHPWLIVFHLVHIFHQPLRKLPGVLLYLEILNIHPSIISLFNSIKW